MVEEGGLVCILKVLDGVEVLEGAPCEDGVLRKSRCSIGGRYITRIYRDREGDSLRGVGKRVSAYNQVTAERDLLSRLAILDRAACCVGGGDGEGIVGETEDVDLEVGECMPEVWLYERLERCKLDDRHLLLIIQASSSSS